MRTYYSNQKNVLILLSCLKQHGIKRIVASPGTSNMPFVASVQQDNYFEVYSSIDERSAAYIACGLAAESGEPVVISCTGATASRNYMPGLTEAFYRKLPILAVTSTQDIARIGQNSPQLIDRRVIPNDIAKMSIHLPELHTEDEEKNYTVLIHSVILELTRRGGGPAHINLTVSDGVKKYEVKELQRVKKIDRISVYDEFPKLFSKKIAIYVGPHKTWSKRLENAVDGFCRSHNAVVLTDHLSNYSGKYGIKSNIITYQCKRNTDITHLDLLIHIGDVIGTDFQGLQFEQVWRVNPDGEVRDTFGKLTYVFEMEEDYFFEGYNGKGDNTSFYKSWKSEEDRIRNKIPELPFSNLWIAQKTLPLLEDDAVIHFAIQNSLRCWNMFPMKKSIQGYCNTGGFGIDGNMSSLIGASLVHPNKTYYGIIGDLAFFYDLNSLGNRHIGKNLRIIVVNNNGGQQFRNHDSSGYQFGEDVNEYMAAAGHFGKQSKRLVKDYAEALGFEYCSASSKQEYEKKLSNFLKPNSSSSRIFEVFVTENDERESMKEITAIEETNKSKAKKVVSGIIGEKTTNTLLKVIR